VTGPLAGIRLTVACALLVLTACATSPPDDSGPGWDDHRRQVENLEHWTAEGKLALRSPDQSESASFQWRQQGEQIRVELSGPLGVNASTITSDGRQVEIVQGEERSVWDVSDPESLARDTGWYLPITALPHWLRGIPAPHFEVEQLGLENQRLALLKQAGWEISYERYSGFDGVSLPTRMQIRRGETSVRLLIRRWLPGRGS